MHYAAKSGEATLEIYPLAKGQTEADKYLRIGFGIENFEAIIAQMKLSGVLF